MDVKSPVPEIYIPIVKSTKEDDGRIRVWGLASDHREDLDGEMVKASENRRCLEYGFVKFDLNHNSARGGVVVGDVRGMRVLPNAEARKKYPNVKDIVGDPIEVEGFVYKMTPNAPDDIKTLHYYQEVGADLGFSIYGTRRPGMSFHRTSDGRTLPVSVPASITTVAITPQPKNDGSVCFMAKSLHAALFGSGDESMELEQGIFDPLSARALILNADIFMKDLSASGDVAPAPGAEGGDALKISNLGDSGAGASETGEKTCPHCASNVLVLMRFCPHCGKSLPQGADTPARKKARELVKAMSPVILDRHLDAQTQFVKSDIAELKRHCAMLR